MNGRTNSSGTTINDLEIPLDPCTNLVAVAGNGQVSLTWTDPKDKYATPEGEAMEDTDQLVSVWAYTRIVRKTDSAPASPNDGVLVVESSVRNQYQNTAYVDSGLTNDTMYYYGVYAYNKDGVASPGAFVNATPKAGTPLSELDVGTIIKINENGYPVEFFLAKHNYEPDLNGQGRELLVRKDCYDRRAWSDANANMWEFSDLREWLNSGYKALFSGNVQAMIGNTAYYFSPGNGDWTVTTRSDAIFSLSATELNLSGDIGEWNIEGAALPVANTLRTTQFNGSNCTQWTRTADKSFRYRAIFVELDGTASNRNTEHFDYSRPCFTLPADTLIDLDLNLVEPT